MPPPQSQTSQAASEAKHEGREVVQHARQEGQAVTQHAVQEGKEIAAEAKTEATHVLNDVKSQLQDQADQQAKRAAESLRKTADEVQALAHGKPEQAGPLTKYAEQAATKIDELARHVESRGYEGVVHDVQQFARRRPAAFLLGTAAGGFLAGRVFAGLKPQQQSDRSASPAAPSPAAQAAVPRTAQPIPPPTPPLAPPRAAPPVTGPSLATPQPEHEEVRR